MSSRNPRPLESLLLPLKPESLQCLHRFSEYQRPIETRRFPKRRRASVAICIFIGRLGDLYLLLSTRAGNMRSFASDTALPGGKYEDGDEGEEGTARREAYEEIGLPQDHDKVRLLCLLDPFLTGNGLIVTPVVFLITDNTINPILNPSEVVHLFSMPLTSFLYSHPSKIPGWHFGISTRISNAIIPEQPPPPVVIYADGEGKVGKPYSSGKKGKSKADQYGYGTVAKTIGSKEDDGDNDDQQGEGTDNNRYYGYRDVPWGGGTVRMHRFLTGREGIGVRPVYGLTSAILIKAAMIGYEQKPEFEVFAPGQKSMIERIEYEVKYGSGPLRRAIEAEGVLEDWIDPKARL